ncbi:MAG: ATP-dependent acyl-CoA ligase [Pseudolabrys sp.]
MPQRFALQDRTLPVMLARQAERYGDKPLFVCGGSTWSYSDTVAVAASSAGRLRAAGIQVGDRVAIICSNRPEFLEIYLGCAWMGAVAVPINTAMRGTQLTHVLKNSRPALLFVEADFIENLVSVDDASAIPELIWTTDDGLNGEVMVLPASAGPIEASVVKPGDTVAILYTSGTTGPSKGVCCPQSQFFWWGVYTAKALGIVEHDVLLSSLPIFHTNALNAFYQALLNGCTYVLEQRFSASGFWDAARQSGATVTYLLGAMAAILLSRPALPSDRNHAIRVALGGGVPAEYHGPFLDRFGVPLVDGYGSTETNFIFATSAPSDCPGTMGRSLGSADVRVVDENDAELPTGKSGELVLRPREPFSFASGYFGMPEKTVEAWRNLWFHSGDRVVRQPDDNYRFVDRMKDSIRRRGENISTWEVERLLLGHPGVDSCAVYALPSELGEDEVAAAVKARPSVALDELDLVKYLEGRIAYFAIPRFIRFVDSFPITENGKIRKAALRDARGGEDR